VAVVANAPPPRAPAGPRSRPQPAPRAPSSHPVLLPHAPRGRTHQLHIRGHHVCCHRNVPPRPPAHSLPIHHEDTRLWPPRTSPSHTRNLLEASQRPPLAALAADPGTGIPPVLSTGPLLAPVNSGAAGRTCPAHPPSCLARHNATNRAPRETPTQTPRPQAMPIREPRRSYPCTATEIQIPQATLTAFGTTGGPTGPQRQQPNHPGPQWMDNTEPHRQNARPSRDGASRQKCPPDAFLTATPKPSTGRREPAPRSLCQVPPDPRQGTRRAQHAHQAPQG